MFAFGSNSQRIEIWSLTLTESGFIGVIFFFFIFFSASLSFVSLLLAAANKRILLSWELITVLLPTLTSLKYTHVSK